MALTYVGGTSGGGTGASYTVSLNGTLTGGSNSSPSPGDLILVFCGETNSGAVTPTCSGNTSGAYTTNGTVQNQADTGDANLAKWYAFAGATPDTTLTITRGSNNTTHGSATVVQVWRGAHATTPFNVTQVQVGASNASAANPGAITPTTAGSVVIYCGHASQVAASGTAFTAAGTYPITVKNDGSTYDSIIMVAAYTAWTSGAYDPAAFTGSTTTTALAWEAVTIVIQPAAVVDYPLTCNSGSYSYTGSSASINRGRSLTSNTGSYTYTGSSATLTKGAALNNRDLTANAGNYTYTGSNATLVRGRSLAANAGSYTYSGQTATLRKNRALVSSAGSYTYTGSSASLSRNRQLSLSAGSYTYTGSNATITKAAALNNRDLTAQAGSYSYTGSSAALSIGLSLTANAGSYSYTGQSATLVYGKSLSANAGSYAYTGQSAEIRRALSLSANAGSYAYTGSSADLTKGAALNHRSLIAQSGSYAYTGSNASLLLGRNLSADSGAYAYTGSPAEITWRDPGHSIIALPGVYALTGSSIEITVPSSAHGGALPSTIKAIAERERRRQLKQQDDERKKREAVLAEIEAKREADARAEFEAQELIARLSRIDDPTDKDSLSVAANDDTANLDAATDSALRKISVSFSTLNEQFARNSESTDALTEQISINAFSDDDALALIMILAEIN